MKDLHRQVKILMCVCVRFTPFIISLERVWDATLSSACKFDQTDFTDSICFLPSNFLDEISNTYDSNTEALSANT